MGLFDVFTFKKQAQEVFTAANFEKVLTTAKQAIVSQVKTKIPGQEKKDNVDQIVIGLVENKANECTNGIIKWVLGLIAKNIPTVTQLVYDFLKEKVTNL